MEGLKIKRSSKSGHTISSDNQPFPQSLNSGTPDRKNSTYR